jgi:hypothetical protein
VRIEPSVAAKSCFLTEESNLRSLSKLHDNYLYKMSKRKVKIMNVSYTGVSMCIAFFLILTFPKNLFPEYIEGIDTTDENRYGLDSAFSINPLLSGQRLVCYSSPRFGPMCNLFNYSFEEILLAADSSSLPGVYLNGVNNYKVSFVVRKSRDSCFSKVKVLNELGDGRLVYRYGTNTAHLNRLMQFSNYDRSIKYKPNNLYYQFDVNTRRDNNIFAWEPPLSNDNHLQGYIIYVQKRNIVIDTTAPINIAQWDSVGFTDTTTIAFNYSPLGEYYNIVAVYAEGKSDFLKGWSTLARPDNIISVPISINSKNVPLIFKSLNGIFINLNRPQQPSLINILNVSGKIITNLPNAANGHILWKTSLLRVPVGLYLLRAEFPDRSVITQPFTVTR